MKTKLILFVLLFVSASSTVRAQYYPLVDTGRVWTNTTCGFAPFGMACNTQYYKLEQDTVIGSFTYKGVWHSSDSGLVNANWFLQGFMREDAAKKVYYINYNDTQEFLFYDFDLTVGDTAHLGNYGGPVDIVVDSVSTILISNQLRNVFYLRPTNSSFFLYYQTWIEGIGSLDELLIMAAPYVDYESELICFHENDTLKYFNINYTDCYYNTLGINEYDAQGFVSLSPNPTDGKFTINFPEHFNYDEALVSITDISGKIISENKIVPSENAEIDLSAMPAGIYFVHVTAKGFAPLPGKVAVY